MNRVKFLVPFLTIIFGAFIFFYPFFLYGKLPIPADTVVGLYHPFRDLYADNYPNGIPFKNFLVTDPVRQQYPWKQFAIESIKSKKLPIWNPYEMAGKPQLANFQTGVFYPLNSILFISPFSISWSYFIFLQLALGGIFIYLYLKNLKINSYASVFGSFCFTFSGFMIAWLEWGVVGHTYIWLPFILLSVDKIVSSLHKKAVYIWSLLLLSGLLFSFFAGHLQTFFYLTLLSAAYFIFAIFQNRKQVLRKSLLVLAVWILFIIFSSIQWIPTLQFLAVSNRAGDQMWTTQGWFLPLQNLAMFFVPDYFGNPATLNYFGVWNYAEFIGYIGLPGILFALFAIFYKREKKTFFYVAIILISFVFIISNPISKALYIFEIPFISTAQPTRLIGIVSFSLSVLAAMGFDLFLKRKNGIWIPFVILGTILLTLFLITKSSFFYPDIENALVSQNNLKLPSLLFAILFLAILFIKLFKTKHIQILLILFLLLITVFDLFRFGWKFSPFTSAEYIYPKSEIITYLQNQNKGFRIVTLDDRILPPNFQTVYKIKSLNGYDPLYLTNYAQLIAANERSDHGITPPFGFNRILVPKNIQTQIFDMLHVRYVLSFEKLQAPQYKHILTEGTTMLYENENVFPYAFFVENVIEKNTRQEIAENLFTHDLKTTAIVHTKDSLKQNYSMGTVSKIEFTENNQTFETENNGEGLLVISEIYYPAVFVTIDGKETKIYEVNLALRGIVIPPGKHTIEIRNKLIGL